MIGISRKMPQKECQFVTNFPEKKKAPLAEKLALTKQGLEVVCGGGDVLVIRELQAEGGKRMAAADYFRGHPITI